MLNVVRTSVRAKITAIVAVAVLSAVLLAAAAAAWREANKRFAFKRTELDGVAATLAAASSRPLANGNMNELGRALSAISRIPGIEFAQVIDTQGRHVYQLGNSVVLENKGSRIEPNAGLSLLSRQSLRNYVIETTIVHEGESIGTLRIIADVSELQNALWDSLFDASIAALLAAMFGALLSRKMQKSVTAPISSLTSAMQDIRSTHDFSKNVARTSDDETGLMVEAFNDMLVQIRNRDNRLAQHRERLEQEVEDRTADLKKATLEAQAANNAKSEFLATMSHEIRTPLNGMLVMAELLSTGNLPDRLQRQADVIVGSGKTLLAIINDILDLSKIEAGKLELEMLPVGLSAISDQVMNLFSARAAGKGIDLACYVAPNVPQLVYADPVRLNQILANLVNNALKFTENGSVVLEVGRIDATELGANRCRLEFCVRDTGIGIPQDKIDLIFERFSQADQSTTRKFGGTGIGLSISKRLVAAMGGTIGVESTPGQGSRFHFTIDCDVVEQGAVAGAPADRTPHVVVSMEPSATRNILLRLITNGAMVPVLENELEGLAEIGGSICAVISDPGRIAKAGTDVTQWTGKQDGRKHPPLRAVIANIGDTGASKAIEYGLADELLARPLSGAQLAEFLARAAADMQPERSSTKADKHRDSGIPQFHGLRVLAADDTAVNREVLSEALDRLGIKVTLVSDGMEATEAVKAHEFDIIFMDCSMPVLDGYEATREIRAFEAAEGRKPVPVIALTAHVAGSAATTWQTAGMSDYVTKPFTLKTIAAAISKWAEPSSPAPPVRDQAAGPVDTPRTESAQGTQIPILDSAVLEDLAETGGPGGDLVARILHLYRTHTPQALENVETAVRSGDAAQIASMAHALKSMCRNIGAVKLSHTLDTIETNARDGVLDAVPAAAATLRGELSEVLAELDRFERGASHPAGISTRRQA